MIGLQCARWRAALVDFADGRLEEPARASVERHLSRCADCAQTVLALREVPAELVRRVRPAPDERFWKEQRRRIGEAIDRGKTIDSRPEVRAIREMREMRWMRPSATAWWRIASALAAAAAVFVVLARGLTSAPELPARIAAAPTTPAVRNASNESLAMFVDEPAVVAPVDVASADDSTLAGLDESLEDTLAGYSDGHLI